jgi:branched-chain amino acid transport system permease protein
MFWAARNMVAGRTGRAMVAIRDHPIAAATMGVNTALVKSLTFGVSAFYTGIAGSLGGIVVGFVAPDSFSILLSLSFLVGIVVGGLASIWGALFGALFIVFVPNYADQISDLLGERAKALPWAIYGLLLIAVMYLMPTGVVGMLRAVATRVVAARGPRTLVGKTE